MTSSLSFDAEAAKNRPVSKVITLLKDMLKQLEKEARQLESTNCKLENVLNQAQKDHERLIDELKGKEACVNTTNKKIDVLGEEES